MKWRYKTECTICKKQMESFFCKCHLKAAACILIAAFCAGAVEYFHRQNDRDGLYVALLVMILFVLIAIYYCCGRKISRDKSGLNYLYH